MVGEIKLAFASPNGIPVTGKDSHVVYLCMANDDGGKLICYSSICGEKSVRI